MTSAMLRTADGCAVAYDVQGPPTGDTAVLLHALGLDRSLWDDIAGALSEHYRVVRVDFRGHGGSATPAVAWTIATLGMDVLAVMDALEIGRAHVVGVSLGGLAALWLGINAPDRIRSLVAANTAARIGTATGWSDRIATVRAQGLAPIADAAPGRWFTGECLVARPAIVDPCVVRLRSTSVEGYVATCEVLGDTDLRPDTGRITSPTAVIGGTADVATPPSDAEWLAATIPGASLHLLTAGHLSNVERPTEFLAVLRETFARAKSEA